MLCSQEMCLVTNDMKYSLIMDTSIRSDGKTYACQKIHQQLKCKFSGKRIVGDGNIQGVPGGKDLTSGECSLGQTITI